jgi:hypothetical protein
MNSLLARRREQTAKTHRTRWLRVTALALIVLALTLGGPVERAINDRATPAVAGTVVIDAVMPPEPVAIDEKEPLPERLTVLDPTPVNVPEGSALIGAGVVLTLQQDRGEEVDVRFGSAVVPLPRQSVVAAPAQPSMPVAVVGSVTRALQSFIRAPASSFGVHAKEIGTGRGMDRKWQTYYGSYDRDFYRSKGLQVDITNVSRRGSGPIEVAVYWVARRLHDRSRHIHHAEHFLIKIESASGASIVSYCPILKSSVTNYEALRERYVSGSKFDGWFVLVRRQLLAGKGCDGVYDELIKNPGAIAPLLATYTRGGRARATRTLPNWRHEKDAALPGYPSE